MKQYKLLKDLPTFKAGQLAYISKTGNLIAGTPENQETTDYGLIIMIYHETTLKKFPNILTEWFEEMEEPTTSVRLTPEEAAEARDRRLAEVRLQRTSTFKPDFENGNGGYVVSYDYINKKLDCSDSFWNDSGEPVRYETKEEALKSIKENERDWKIFFGIKEEE